MIPVNNVFFLSKINFLLANKFNNFCFVSEEAYIADLDSKSGASLKLTILNKKGRIWTMVAGGGASVIYSDTICDLGGASELANYGEYSGNILTQVILNS